MTAKRLRWWQSVLLWPPLRFVLPTVTALYVNHHYLSGPVRTAALPEQQWARREAHGLLSRSEDRLRSIETKGPGLATVGAIVATGVVAAIVEGGPDATLLGKILLGLAAWYALWSLVVPIYLVGPQARSTIDLPDLVAAGGQPSPEQFLADQAQQAAQENVRRTQRLGNLQDAARNELAAALAALVIWVVLGPATGLLRNEDTAETAPQSALPAATTSLPAPLTTPLPVLPPAKTVPSNPKPKKKPKRRRSSGSAPAGN